MFTDLEQQRRSSARHTARDPAGNPQRGRLLHGREAVLARAETWLTAWNGGPVPYLSSTDPATWFQGYRRDCSGYASMALGLPVQA